MRWDVKCSHYKNASFIWFLDNVQIALNIPWYGTRVSWFSVWLGHELSVSQLSIYESYDTSGNVYLSDLITTNSYNSCASSLGTEISRQKTAQNFVNYVDPQDFFLNLILRASFCARGQDFSNELSIIQENRSGRGFMDEGILEWVQDLPLWWL